MEYLPTWLGQLLVGAAGLSLAAILVTGATAACTFIYRRYIKVPNTVAVTVTTSTSSAGSKWSACAPLAPAVLPVGPIQAAPQVQESSDDGVKCGKCGNSITTKPIYSRLTDNGVILVYKCQNCQTEVGLGT